LTDVKGNPGMCGNAEIRLPRMPNHFCFYWSSNFGATPSSISSEDYIPRFYIGNSQHYCPGKGMGIGKEWKLSFQFWIDNFHTRKRHVSGAELILFQSSSQGRSGYSQSAGCCREIPFRSRHNLSNVFPLHIIE